jgi:hypothetical protein
MHLYAWTGDGRPGPYDGGSYSPPAAGIEWGVHELSTLFHDELVKRSIPIDYRDYGPGTHTWAYWERDLRELMGPLMADFAQADPAPATVDFQSDAAQWSQWGWNVKVDRPAREFSRLSNAGRSGFTLSGSGDATVLTPPLYKPRALARVSMAGSGARTLQRVRADTKGRLRLLVPLGPGNAAQEFTPGATTREYSTAVRVTVSKRR